MSENVFIYFSVIFQLFCIPLCNAEIKFIQRDKQTKIVVSIDCIGSTL